MASSKLFFRRLTSPLDATKYSLEECGEHTGELSNHSQGLHDFVLEDVDELLCTGKLNFQKSISLQ